MLKLFCQDFEISITMYHFHISTPLCASYPFYSQLTRQGALLNCCDPKIYTSAMATRLNESEYRMN